MVSKSEREATVKEQKVETGSTLKSKSNNSVLEYTDIDDISRGVERLRFAFHNKGKTHSIQYRLNQLRNAYFAVKDNVDQLCDALQKDFHRPPSETMTLEVSLGLAELIKIMANLHKWAQPSAVTDLTVSFKGTPIYVERIPLGVVLVISPYNYPFLLSFSAVVGAIAAGNAVVLKQSEATPHFSQLFSEILSGALDEDIFFAVNGAVPETTALLDQKFDKIMYTGNNTVGKIVAKKAAETLTPVILELGGKSPAFVLDDLNDSDIQTVAQRIAWGAFCNAGQTCVASDYVLVHSSKKQKLVDALKKVVEEKFYRNIDKNDVNFAHMIHSRAYDGVMSKIKSSKGKIITGGFGDAASRYIAPTVIDNVSWDDSTMQSEIFGPILPILEYSDLDSAIDEARRQHDTPLALYIFTGGAQSRKKNVEVDKIRAKIRSGGTIVNDVVMHVAITSAPFGGVGQSGNGSYHGFNSFKAFTHERTVMEQKFFNEFVLMSRYPPYKSKNDKLVERSFNAYNGDTWFKRTGDVQVGGPNYAWSAWKGFTGFLNLAYTFFHG
ncbi:Piso0_001508 [Millerozyma farinosa CBS 7064]|uniref:Aldehyde dehydrogenase n=1 Tax=Pichia sorbitophila (strain ATCC MYA-4447 / BCRC 22081 / CBS 7064 / NBRC 10061 / NRRL Y-12695) TaxID=559304 RepID=G8YNC7_PICSO|nr:Piso0_001508 [Millerozyma farinosa CBS 7064]